MGVFSREISQLSKIRPPPSFRSHLSSSPMGVFSRDYGKIYFVFFIVVVYANHENIFTTKISRFTVVNLQSILIVPYVLLVCVQTYSWYTSMAQFPIFNSPPSATNFYTITVSGTNAQSSRLMHHCCSTNRLPENIELQAYTNTM